MSSRLETKRLQYNEKTRRAFDSSNYYPELQVFRHIGNIYIYIYIYIYIHVIGGGVAGI